MAVGISHLALKELKRSEGNNVPHFINELFLAALSGKFLSMNLH